MKRGIVIEISRSHRESRFFAEARERNSGEPGKKCRTRRRVSWARSHTGSCESELCQRIGRVFVGKGRESSRRCGRRGCGGVVFSSQNGGWWLRKKQVGHNVQKVLRYRVSRNPSHESSEGTVEETTLAGNAREAHVGDFTFTPDDFAHVCSSTLSRTSRFSAHSRQDVENRSGVDDSPKKLDRPPG